MVIGRVASVRIRGLTFVLALAATLALAPGPALARVPQGFVGTMLDGPFYYPSIGQSQQMDTMVASGVQSVRTVFSWATMQPYSNFAAVPANLRGSFENENGVPTNFAGTDTVVALAAEHRMSVLPIVIYSPSWDSTNPSNVAAPPSRTAPYAHFLQALIGRYGPHGSFWSTNPSIPRVPIRMWQIWNEPNFTAYWSRQPFARPYVALLKAAHSAVKRADPGAKVVLAGLANYSWRYLASIYKVRGARDAFDIAAIHPFTATPARLIEILQKARAVMSKAGDRRKSMLVTEFSWPSAQGKARTTFENATTEAGQAKRIRQTLSLLAHDRVKLRLLGFYYYTWITNESPGAQIDEFNYAGLIRFIDGQGSFAKPALAAFRQTALSIEGCRRKGTVATSCL